MHYPTQKRETCLLYACMYVCTYASCFSIEAVYRAPMDVTACMSVQCVHPGHVKQAIHVHNALCIPSFG